MFRKIINYIDSLFYTTTITTTVRRTTTAFTPTEEEEVSITGIRETSVTHEGSYFRVNDKVVPIPAVVRDRKPLSDEDSFPHYRDHPIIMYLSTQEGGHAPFVDEVRISRNSEFRDYNKAKISSEISAALDQKLCDDAKSGVFAKVVSEDIGVIEMYYTSEWILITIEMTDDYNLVLFHKNSSLAHSASECVVAAYAYTRALLLNTSSDDFNVDEDHLATTFLAMMLTHRV